MNTLSRNTRLYYIISFLEACIFTTPIWAFFFTSYLEFSFSTALNLIILSGIVSFLFEIPSGSWADKYGRKKMYFIGTLLAIISFGMWAFIENIYFFIFAAVLNGIAFSITSGNFEALIHDALEENKQEKNFKNIHSNAYISIFLGRALSSAIAGYLFLLHPLFPTYATVGAYIIVIFMLFFVREGQQIIEPNSTTTHIKSGLQYVYADSYIFMFIIIMATITGLGNIYWFSYQPYLHEIGVSIKNIGLVFALTGIFSAIGAHIIKKLQNRYSEKNILLIILGLSLLSGVLLQFFTILGAIIGIAILSIMFGFLMSFGNNILIQLSPKTHKSTILSIFSFAITLGYALFAIISGYFIDYIGIFKVYLGTLILTIILFIITFIFFKNRKT